MKHSPYKRSHFTACLLLFSPASSPSFPLSHTCSFSRIPTCVPSSRISSEQLTLKLCYFKMELAALRRCLPSMSTSSWPGAQLCRLRSWSSTAFWSSDASHLSAMEHIKLIRDQQTDQISLSLPHLFTTRTVTAIWIRMLTSA